VACSYGRDENRWQNMGKKMWDKLERYGQNEELIGKRYQWK